MFLNKLFKRVNGQIGKKMNDAGIGFYSYTHYLPLTDNSDGTCIRGPYPSFKAASGQISRPVPRLRVVRFRWSVPQGAVTPKQTSFSFY